MKRIAVLFILLTLAAMAAKPGYEQWLTLPPLSGGINIVSDQFQIPSGQIRNAINFLWTHGQLQSRNGYWRLSDPLSNLGVTFLSLFRTVDGNSYLFFSDDEKIWYLTQWRTPAIQLDMGRTDSGTVDIYDGVAQVRGNAIANQRWRTTLGTSEGDTITVSDTVRVIDYILLDTMLYTTVAYTESGAKSYSMDLRAGKINDAFAVGNDYWFFTGAGKARFTNPDSLVIIDSLVAQRWKESVAETRMCKNTYYPTIRISGYGSSYPDYSGKFLRFVTNPASNGTPKNPIPAGKFFYTSYPIYQSSGAYVYSLLAAFQTDTTATQYYTIEDLEYDSSSKYTVVLDSLLMYAADSATFTCSGSGYRNDALYFKLFCDTCDWQSDTMRFATGDWFFTYPYTDTTMGGLGGAGADPVTFVINDTIAARKITTGNHYFRAFSIDVPVYAKWTYNGANIKGAIYNYNTKALLDTTKTTVSGNVLIGSTVNYSLKFASPANLNPSTAYLLAVWSDQVGVTLYHKYPTGTGYNEFINPETYTGTFPTSLGATDSTTEVLDISVVTDYYNPNIQMATSAFDCYPVIGGYVDTDSSILVGVSKMWSQSRDDWHWQDLDTVNAVFFRMKANKSTNDVNAIDFAVFHNGVCFEVRAANRDQIWYSELNMPDSFMNDHVVVVEAGNPIVCGAPQLGDLVVYTSKNRWKIVYAGGESYGKQALDGFRGCIAKKSFLNIDGIHYGLGADGYWQTGGEAPQLISTPVATYFSDTLDYDHLNLVTAGYDATNDNIWISFPRRGSIANDVTLVYNRETQSWWPQTLVAGSYLYNSDRMLSDSIQFLFGAADSSALYVMGGYVDDGNSFVATIELPYTDAGDPQFYKGLKAVKLHCEAQSPYTLGTAAWGDFLTTPRDTFDLSVTSAWQEKQLLFHESDSWGRYVAERFTFTPATGLRIPTIRLLISKKEIEQ